MDTARGCDCVDGLCRGLPRVSEKFFAPLRGTYPAFAYSPAHFFSCAGAAFYNGFLPGDPEAVAVCLGGYGADRDVDHYSAGFAATLAGDRRCRRRGWTQLGVNFLLGCRLAGSHRQPD